MECFPLRYSQKIPNSLKVFFYIKVSQALMDRVTKASLRKYSERILKWKFPKILYFFSVDATLAREGYKVFIWRNSLVISGKIYRAIVLLPIVFFVTQEKKHPYRNTLSLDWPQFVMRKNIWIWSSSFVTQKQIGRCCFLDLFAFHDRLVILLLLLFNFAEFFMFFCCR